MDKNYEATQKYFLMSPRKIRLVTDLVKKMKPTEAIEKLPFVHKRAAEVVAKVIKSAIANASSQGVDAGTLIFKEIQIGQGPRLKRGMAVSRGRWHPRVKRMSHIRVILTVFKEPVSKTKEVKKIENKINDTKEAKDVVKKEEPKKKTERKSNGTKN